MPALNRRVTRPALLYALVLSLVLSQVACVDRTGPSAPCELKQDMGDPTPVCK